jgi:hypothetical protein
VRANFVLLILLSASFCRAWDVRTALSEQRNSLSISGEMSQFKTDGGSISGQGLRLDLAHSFQKNWSAEIFLSTAMGAAGASSFTGYGGYALYDLYSTGRARIQDTTVDGLPLIHESQDQEQLLQVGAGINQFLLNGSRGVYSSSGPGAAANYLFRMFKYNFKTSVRYSSLISNNTSVQAISFSLGMIFPL